MGMCQRYQLTEDQRFDLINSVRVMFGLGSTKSPTAARSPPLSISRTEPDLEVARIIGSAKIGHKNDSDYEIIPKPPPVLTATYATEVSASGVRENCGSKEEPDQEGLLSTSAASSLPEDKAREQSTTPPPLPSPPPPSTLPLSSAPEEGDKSDNSLIGYFSFGLKSRLRSTHSSKSASSAASSSNDPFVATLPQSTSKGRSTRTAEFEEEYFALL